MKLLSYSFFEPKKQSAHRFWDEHKDQPNRYYYNVPAIILSNCLLFPDYITKIYITPNVKDNPLSAVFDIIKEFRPNSLTLEEVDFDYEYTEPASLRFMPLWDDEVSIVHTRDIDSIPTIVEYQYIKCFEESNMGVGVIRTHPNHYGGGCKMLSGLSSFRPSLIPDEIKGSTFTEYFNRTHRGYACEQDLLIQTFTSNHSYTAEYFYDCMAYYQNNIQEFPCHVCSRKKLASVELSAWAKIIFEKVSEFGFNNWAGEPIDCRGPYLDFILKQFPWVFEKIKANNTLKNFYKAG